MSTEYGGAGLNTNLTGRESILGDKVMGELKSILGGTAPVKTEPKPEAAAAPQPTTQQLNQRGVIV